MAILLMDDGAAAADRDRRPRASLLEEETAAPLPYRGAMGTEGRGGPVPAGGGDRLGSREEARLGAAPPAAAARWISGGDAGLFVLLLLVLLLVVG